MVGQHHGEHLQHGAVLAGAGDHGTLTADLDGLQVVAVVADDPRQLHLPDLRQLVAREGGRPAAVLIPEPVSVFEVVEGPAHDAGEGGPHHGARAGHLAHPGGPEIDIVRAGVELAVGLQQGYRDDTSASKSSIRRFVITEKAPTRAFSWLKAPTSAFTFKTLC